MVVGTDCIGSRKSNYHTSQSHTVDHLMQYVQCIYHIFQTKIGQAIINNDYTELKWLLSNGEDVFYQDRVNL